MDQLDTNDADYDVACRWLQSNEEVWKPWLPERGKCFSQFGMYDASCLLLILAHSNSLQTCFHLFSLPLRVFIDYSYSCYSYSSSSSSSSYYYYYYSYSYSYFYSYSYSTHTPTPAASWVQSMLGFCSSGEEPTVFAESGSRCYHLQSLSIRPGLRKCIYTEAGR